MALAGLCTDCESDLAIYAWPYVESAYLRHSKRVADTNRGMLWRPIEKLYKKATAFRDGNPTPRASVSPPNMRMMLGQNQMASIPPLLEQPAPLAIPPLGIHDQGAAFASNEMAGFDDLFDGIGSLPAGDMSWMEWEQVMDDMSGLPLNDPYLSSLQMQPALQGPWTGL